MTCLDVMRAIDLNVQLGFSPVGVEKAGAAAGRQHGDPKLLLAPEFTARKDHPTRDSAPETTPDLVPYVGGGEVLEGLRVCDDAGLLEKQPVPRPVVIARYPRGMHSGTPLRHLP